MIQPSHPASSVTPAAAPMKGIPSLANGMPTARSATEFSLLSFCSYRPVGPSSARASSLAAGPNLFDGMGFTFSQQCIVDRTVRLILQHPLFGELALLNFAQDLPHFLLRLLRHNPRTASDITILGRRTDGIPHVGNAALIDQIHDQFYFMEALEIGHLRGVAGFHERLVPGLDERRESSTEDDLLAEEIRLGFFPKVSFDHTSPPTSNRTGIGKAYLLGRSTWILMDREQARHPAAFRIFRSNEMARSFRSDHEHIDRGRWHNLSKMNIEAMAKREIGARLQIRDNVLPIDGRLRFVRRENHDDIRRL